MSPIDALWHVLNFFAPALAVGLITASFAKLLWRHELKSVGWMRLGVWGTLGCAVTLIVGLVVFGHDGKIATYAAMTGVCAFVLWWVGFGPRWR